MAFGGAIKLTGESEYRKALSQITQQLKETSAEMRTVTSAYDKGDKSTAAVNAQSQVLNKTLVEQNQKLSTLNAQYAAMSSQMQKQTTRHTALVNTYNDEKSKLEQIGKSLGTTSDEYTRQKGVVDNLAKEVTKSTHTQTANEKAMSSMRIQISNAQTDINKTAKALDNLGKEAEESGEDAKKGSEGFTIFKGVVADLASSAIKGGLTAIGNGIKSIASGLIGLGINAIDSYSAYEQLVGGVDTLFGESPKKVQEYAANAYKTAGVSANEYMEQATSFSATLLQGLGGDTAKAAEYADMAIRDMSDNANKMGTDISMIQNAYQGFAKDNYTMLDNLKLGYGGTQSEMARLINDSGVLGKSIEVTAESVKDVPFDKVIEAINVTQQRIGITGTTAAEAAGTLEGSSKSLRASFQNLLTGIADDNADFGTLIQNFVDSVLGAAQNFLPRIQTALGGVSNLIVELTKELLPQVVQLGMETINGLASSIVENVPALMVSLQTIIETILTSLSTLLPQLAPVAVGILTTLTTTLLQNLPLIIQVGMDMIVSLIQGLVDALPQLMAMLPSIITTTVDTLWGNISAIIEVGLQLLVALIDGLTQAIPQLMDYVPQIIGTIVSVLMANLPSIIEAAIQIVVSLINGLIQALPQLVTMAPQIIITIVTALIASLPDIVRTGGKLIASLIEGIGSMIGTLAGEAAKIVTTVVDKIKEMPSKVVEFGTNLVKGIWNGIRDATGWILDKIKGFGNTVLDGIKKVFGIASPSKVMRDQVGKYLADGIGVGFTDEMKSVTKDIQKALPTSFEINTDVTASTNLKRSIVEQQAGYSQDYSNHFDAIFKVEQMTVRNDTDIRKLSAQIEAVTRNILGGKGVKA